MRKIYIIISLLLFTMISCNFSHEPKVVLNESAQYYSVSKDLNILADTEYDSIIAIYKVGVDSVMGEYIVDSEQGLSRKRPSGALNNLIADAMRIEISKEVDFNVDFAMYNYYGIRNTLPKGKIIKGNIFEVLPFENQATLVHLSPKGMKELLTYIYKSGGQPISGLEIEYTDSINYNATIGGNKFDTTAYYWVVTSDYAANGGDNMSFFQESDSIFYTGILIRNNLLSYLENLNAKNLKLTADTVSRITYNKQLEM